jgi:hypothetical protein
MKINWKVLIVFLAVLCMYSQGSSVFALNDYVLVFDGKDLVLSSEVDYIELGEVLAGSNCSRTIRIKNSSQEVLWIANVRGSCGLSVPLWPRDYVDPGKEATIQIRYDCSRPGPINRNITIHANTSNAKTIFSVRGRVIPVK